MKEKISKKVEKISKKGLTIRKACAIIIQHLRVTLPQNTNTNFFEKIFKKGLTKQFVCGIIYESLASEWEHSSAGRASALQAEGHRFEPYCSHHSGPVAQLVRAPACHAGGRGFEPHPGRHYTNTALAVCLCSSVGRAGD